VLEAARPHWRFQLWLDKDREASLAVSNGDTLRAEPSIDAALSQLSDARELIFHGKRALKDIQSGAQESTKKRPIKYDIFLVN
jgi:hypothetical protein